MNYWAILLAAVSTFMLGGLWYSAKLFGRIWQQESGTPEKQGHAGRDFAVSFGYHAVQFLLFGLVFGLWL